MDANYLMQLLRNKGYPQNQGEDFAAMADAGYFNQPVSDSPQDLQMYPNQNSRLQDRLATPTPPQNIPEQRNALAKILTPENSNGTVSTLNGWGAQATKEKQALDAMFQGAIAGNDLEKASRLATTPEQQALLSVAYGNRINQQDYRARTDAGIPTQAPPDLIKNYQDAQWTNVMRQRGEEDRQMKLQAGRDTSAKTQAETELDKSRATLSAAQAAMAGAPTAGAPNLLGMTPESLRIAAENNLKDGSLPPNMGRGLQGTAQSTLIRNEAAKLAEARGIDPNDVRTGQYQFKNAMKVASAGEQNFNARNGPMIRGFNTLVDHLATAKDLMDAMNNGDIRAVNEAKNYFEAQTGQAAPTNLAAARQYIAAEGVRAVTGAAGALGDRQEAEKGLSGSASPEQFNGTVDTITRLALGQLRSHEQQLKSVVGPNANFDKYLTPKSRELFSQYGGTTPVAGQLSQPLSGVQVPPMPTTKDKLVAGQVYSTPRGNAKWNGSAFEAQ